MDTFSINDTRHNNNIIILSVATTSVARLIVLFLIVMLNVIMLSVVVLRVIRPLKLTLKGLHSKG